MPVANVKEYNILGPLVKGGQGSTMKAVAVMKGDESKVVVIIKKLENPFDCLENTKRAFREFILLSSLQHPNLITMFDVLIPPNATKNPSKFMELSFVTEYAGSTLHEILQFRQANGIKWINKEISSTIFQLLNGLNYLHQSNIIHRDLKPNNIVLNKEGQLKILDYGLARTMVNDMKMTPKVAVPFYRAPEIFLDIPNYGNKVDIWSVGCILAEILRDGFRLFSGSDFYAQWPQFVALLGNPPKFDCFGAEIGQEFFEFIMHKQFYGIEPKNPADYLPDNAKFEEGTAGLNVDNARQIVVKMLVYEPNCRPSAEEALNEEYFNQFNQQISKKINPIAEMDLQKIEQENGHSLQRWKEKLFNEIMAYREENRVIDDDKNNNRLKKWIKKII